MINGNFLSRGRGWLAALLLLAETGPSVADQSPSEIALFTSIPIGAGQYCDVSPIRLRILTKSVVRLLIERVPDKDELTNVLSHFYETIQWNADIQRENSGKPGFPCSMTLKNLDKLEKWLAAQ